MSHTNLILSEGPQVILKGLIRLVGNEIVALAFDLINFYFPFSGTAIEELSKLRYVCDSYKTNGLCDIIFRSRSLTGCVSRDDLKHDICGSRNVNSTLSMTSAGER